MKQAGEQPLPRFSAPRIAQLGGGTDDAELGALLSLLEARLGWI